MTRNEMEVQLQPALRDGNLEDCIQRVLEELGSLPHSPYHAIARVRFSNNPRDVAEYIGQFLQAERARFDVKALYVETNGFDINPDRWYFDLFAFDTYGGHEDYDWLSEWQSEYIADMTLTGLEAMQEVYARAGEYRQFDGARSLASLLVTLYFQDLIKQSAPLIPGLNVPILTTSHDSNFILECR